MDDLLTTLRGGLEPGYNALLRAEDDPEVGLDFGVHLLPAGISKELSSPQKECAWLVIRGQGTLSLGSRSLDFARPDWIETGPTVAHVPAGGRCEVIALGECEVAQVAVEGGGSFEPRLLGPAEVPTEHRGQGMLEETSYRLVRCAFDRQTAPAESNLVLGEVVNFPGRWSSYPPHHHPQPEVYYYRFAPEQGYGHGELGERVFQLRGHDLLRITGGRDHSQVSAPGYHMYYIWAIRHLEGSPYTGFEFTPEHAWLLEEEGS